MGKTVTTSYLKFGFIRIGRGRDAYAQCKLCDLTLNNTEAIRLQKHQQKCPKTKEVGDNNIEENQEAIDIDEPAQKKQKHSSVAACSSNTNADAESGSENMTPSSAINKTPTSCFSTPGSSRVKQQTLKSFADRPMSKIEGQRAQQNLVNFFLANKLPFSLVEDFYFKKFILNLRPGFTKYMPCRQTLGGNLLDKSLEKFKQQLICTEVQDYCLLIDSWKNSVTKDKWLCFILHSTSAKPIYLKSELVTEISETGTYLSEMVSFGMFLFTFFIHDV